MLKTLRLTRAILSQKMRFLAILPKSGWGKQVTFSKILRFLHIVIQGSKYKLSTKKLPLVSPSFSFSEEASTCMNFKFWIKEASASTCFLYPDFLYLLPYPDFEDVLTSLKNVLTSFIEIKAMMRCDLLPICI